MAFWSLRKIAGKIFDEDLKSRLLAEPGLLCGMDEVGRGPWAGPVVASAFMMPVSFRMGGLRDSKQLTEEKREEFYSLFMTRSWTGTGMADETEIDDIGLSGAIRLAYKRALTNLVERNGGIEPAFLLIDGRDKLDLPYPSLSVIKGDEKIRHVAAASIVAKVERDRLMKKLAKKYPEYGFERHKGYGTERHQQALREHGICKIHRRSFAPVRILSNQ